MKNLKSVNLDDFRQENLDTTVNSKVWRYLTYSLKGLCRYCSPFGGCNKRRSWHSTRSWKDYRKTKYKLK